MAKIKKIKLLSSYENCTSKMKKMRNKSVRKNSKMKLRMRSLHASCKKRRMRQQQLVVVVVAVQVVMVVSLLTQPLFLPRFSSFLLAFSTSFQTPLCYSFKRPCTRRCRISPYVYASVCKGYCCSWSELLLPAPTFPCCVVQKSVERGDGTPIQPSDLDKDQKGVLAVGQALAVSLPQARRKVLAEQATPGSLVQTIGNSPSTAFKVIAAAAADGYIQTADGTQHDITLTLNLRANDVTDTANTTNTSEIALAKIKVACVYVESLKTWFFASGQKGSMHNRLCPFRLRVLKGIVQLRIIFGKEVKTCDFAFKPSGKPVIEMRQKDTPISVYVENQFSVPEGYPDGAYPLDLMQEPLHITITATAVGTGTYGDGGNYSDPKIVELRSAGKVLRQ